MFEFLPETLDPAAANKLGEELRSEAADTGDKRVWEKYKPRWHDPGAAARIDGYLSGAIRHYHQKYPHGKPNYAEVGERAEAALLGTGVPNWLGLEGEVESLLAADLLVPGRSAADPARFPTDEIWSYFIAVFWSSKGEQSRVKPFSADERFAGAFTFLPRMLEKPGRDELGRFLESENKRQPLAAWEQYRKHWKRRRAGQAGPT
ncbi:MAG TPA: hypothetical protein VH092_32760 [Urbifossiella sp.]|nr:hypothetical protein [Urbifossiella sp.]